MNNFKYTVTRYTSFLRWLLSDAFGLNKWLGLAIVATGVMGVAFQVKVFGLIVIYAQHFASGKELNLAGIIIDPRSSVPLLMGGGLIVVLLLSLSSISIYFSKHNTLRLGRQYEEFCAKRVFSLLGHNIDVFPVPEGKSTGEPYLIRLFRADSKSAGRMLRMFLSLITPGLSLVIALAALLYLEFILTIIIGLLGIGLLICQYRISRKAAGYSINLEKLAPIAGKESRVLIGYLKQQGILDESHALVEKAFSRGPIKKHQDAYEGRLRVIAISQLVSGLFLAFIFGLIIVIMVWGIIRDGTGWGRLLVFVMALRFAMAKLQQSFVIVTSINRLYPQVQRYFQFVQSFNQKDRGNWPPLDAYDLRLAGQGAAGTILAGSSSCMIIQPGISMALVTPVELNRYTMAEILRGLLGENERAFRAALYFSRFATSRHSCPSCSLERILELPEGSGWKDIDLPVKITERLKQHLSKSLDRDIKPKIWEKTEPDLKFVLALSSALASGAQWILLEEKGLHLLDDEARSFFHARMADRVTVIVYKNNLSRVGSYGEHAVAVMGEEGSPIGLGDPEWFKKVQEEVREHLSQTEDKKSTGRQSDEDLDEMDEM